MHHVRHGACLPSTLFYLAPLFPAFLPLSDSVICQDLLTLTWWPLARDSTYYTISLLVLALFFGYISENEIEWCAHA